MSNKVYLADNLLILRALPDESVPLMYFDPPFNTGKIQRRQRIKVVQDAEGDRTGFAEKRYRTIPVNTMQFPDTHDDYLEFLEPRLREAWRVLHPYGTLYLHLDYREVHYVKVLLDTICGRHCFLNEIVWAYDFGGRAKDRWPAKHDTILVYAKNPGEHTFNLKDIDRIPYMAPGLVGKEKAEIGKLPTDVWWHTIVPTNSKERTDYPTQKPTGILRRIITASSNPGDLVLDCFAGSGTTAVVAYELGRSFLVVDNCPEAFEVMQKRLQHLPDVTWYGRENPWVPNQPVI